MADGKEDGSGRNPELEELRDAVRELNGRVSRLEQRIGSSPARRLDVAPRSSRATLESRLGSQYLNRAGIIALLVGVSFAVHWAFSNHWIGAAAIMATGLAGGVAVFALGEWFMLRQYAAFGLSLQALGLGALYLVLWAGFQIYQVIPALAALAGMIVITAATAVAAVVQDSQALAVFAFLGGFATPFLLSTGQNRQIELFVYLLVLTSGMAVTLAFRRWSSLYLASFVACVTVSTAWLISYYTKDEWLSTFILLTLLFAIFLAANVLLGKESKIPLVVVPLATAAYLLAAYVTVGGSRIGVVEILLAAALLAIASATSARLKALYFTLAVACAALFFPAEFDIRWTTSALWLAMGVVLMAAGFRTRQALIRWDALVLIGITVLKVFIFDLSRLAPGCRIVAMAVLGIALLATSFVYQRNWLGLRGD